MPPTKEQMEAAALAQAMAKRNLQRNAGKNYINTNIKKLEVKDGVRTTLTVIAYIVKNGKRSDSDQIKPGMTWYKFPFRIHKKIGSGDDARSIVCPTTWGTDNKCAICTHVAQLREKSYDDNKDTITALRYQHRDLLLVYHHEAKEICYMDEAYGGGNIPAFGSLLDEAITNPAKAADSYFWVAGDGGQDLNVLWKMAGTKGREWLKPVSITFVERTGVPSWVWKKAFDISEMLVRLSSKEVENLFYAVGDDDDEGSQQHDDDDQTPEDSDDTKEDSNEDEDSDDEPGDDDEPDDDDDKFDISKANRGELLTFARENKLTDSKGRIIHKSYAKVDEEKLRRVVTKSWDRYWEDAEKIKCPAGGTFGKDFQDLPGCKDCPTKVMDACASESIPC